MVNPIFSYDIESKCCQSPIWKIPHQYRAYKPLMMRQRGHISASQSTAAMITKPLLSIFSLLSEIFLKYDDVPGYMLYPVC
jgi:hypothetical protein